MFKLVFITQRQLHSRPAAAFNWLSSDVDKPGVQTAKAYFGAMDGTKEKSPFSSSFH